MIHLIQMRKRSREVGGLTYAATDRMQTKTPEHQALEAFEKLYRQPGEIVSTVLLREVEDRDSNTP